MVGPIENEEGEIPERQGTVYTPRTGGLSVVPRSPAASELTPAAQPGMSATVQPDGSAVELQLSNAGGSATHLIVHRHHLGVSSERMDFKPGETLNCSVPALSGGYDIAVHGPGGFLRAVAGDMASTLAGFEATLSLIGPVANPGLSLQLRNADRVTRAFSITSRTGPTTSYRLAPGGTREVRFQPLKHDLGYYDLRVTVEGVSSFSRRFAGHLEPGRPPRTS